MYCLAASTSVLGSAPSVSKAAASVSGYTALVTTLLVICTGSVTEDQYVDKTSAVLNKWFSELEKCITEDFVTKTGCGECHIRAVKYGTLCD